MIEYKSDTFIFFIYVFAVFTVLLKVTAFVESWNPLNLITPILATGVVVFLIRMDRRTLGWIRAWAIVEIAAGLLFVSATGCNILLRDTGPITLTEYLKVSAVVISVTIASAFYFLAPDYIVEKKTEQTTESIFTLIKKQEGAA